MNTEENYTAEEYSLQGAISHNKRYPQYQRDLDRIRAKKIVSASMPRIVREVLSGKLNNNNKQLNENERKS